MPPAATRIRRSRAASARRSWAAASRASTRRPCGRVDTRSASASTARRRNPICDWARGDWAIGNASIANQHPSRAPARSRRHDPRRQQPRARKLARGVCRSRGSPGAARRSHRGRHDTENLEVVLGRSRSSPRRTSPARRRAPRSGEAGVASSSASKTRILPRASAMPTATAATSG